MARRSNDPVRHFVNFRVNSEENKILEKLAKKSGLTFYKFIRRELQIINGQE
jgi:hypothetical protein